MCAIDWCSFSWQAFATLVTGFGAVGGAIFIGLRQHGLIREQASIAKDQADTAKNAAHVTKLKLRADLFDRRMAVFLALKTYLRAALSSNTDKIWDATPELEEQLARAQFLFSDSITSEITKAINDSDALYNARLEKNEAQDAGKDAKELIAALGPLRRKLRRRLEKLAETMGDEMKLFDDRSGTVGKTGVSTIVS